MLSDPPSPTLPQKEAGERRGWALSHGLDSHSGIVPPSAKVTGEVTIASELGHLISNFKLSRILSAMAGGPHVWPLVG